MSKLLRRTLAFATIVSALIGVVHVQPSWAASLTMEWASLCELEQTMQRGIHRRLDLDEQWEQTMRRTEGRRRIVAEVVGDRMTLVQAAVEFRRLNQTLPPNAWCYNHAYSGKTEDERLCRYVIRLVQTELSERTPSLAASKTKKLESELQVLLQTDGMVHLPGE